jgi:hypothetical protein
MRHDKHAPKTHTPKATESPKDGIQGEGNYEAAREFNEAERKFVESGKVPVAAREAAPKSTEDQQEMLDAEAKGKKRARK